VPKLYGPYWHYTSSLAVSKIVDSERLRGRPPKLGGARTLTPKVMAWTRHAHADAEHFVCFTTEVRPDRGSPPHLAFWSEGEPGVVTVIADELVEIPITIVRSR
jgi:hypothetical protein